MRQPAQTVREFVAAFIAAWPHRDAASVTSFFTDDAVYHNIPLEPARGREAVVADPIVMVERTDHFLGDDRMISLPMAGVFEVRDGLITAWRDYFDLSGLSSPGAAGSP